MSREGLFLSPNNKLEIPISESNFSHICALCRAMLRNGARASPPTNIHMTSIQSGIDEASHYSIAGLVSQARLGCRLCLTVYNCLNEHLIQDVKVTADDSFTSKGIRTLALELSSIGFVSVIPVGGDYIKLRFRFVRLHPIDDVGLLERKISEDELESPDSRRAESRHRQYTIDYGVWTCYQNNYSARFSRGSSDESRALQSQDVQIELMVMRLSSAVGLGWYPQESEPDGVFKTARRWIRQCSGEHQSYCASQAARWKPTYLLDVTVKNSRGLPGVRLVESVCLEEHEEYVTLSHAWGASKTIRLHSGTMPALKQGVAQSNLPRSLADAALATRKLGYKYLWIDALCIKHDDREAVLAEVSQMHRIYGEAQLNIAATSACSDNDGFLRPGSTTAAQFCPVNLKRQDRMNDMYIVFKTADWKRSIDGSPLCKRAWVLQERALARRTIHFTGNGVMWECSQTRRSEHAPMMLDEDAESQRMRVLMNHSNANAMPYDNTFDKILYHTSTNNWSKLVELYSLGKLSYSSDKLAAISGLARQYITRHQLDGYQYTAGMWRFELPHSLVWRVEKGQRPPGREAPTWSWASTEGKVICPRVGHILVKSCLEVHSINIEHKYQDPFGPVKYARLKVTGCLARGILLRTKVYWGISECSIFFPNVKVDFFVASFDEKLPKLCDVVSGMMETLEVYVLPVVSTSDRVEGLLLNATTTKAEYARIGTFKTSSSLHRDKFRTAMMGDPGMSNYGLRSVSDRQFWFDSGYRYSITVT